MKPYFSFFVLVMFTGIAFAQDAVKPESGSPAKAETVTNKVTGQIVSIDAANAILCVRYVKTDTLVATISINAETQIKKGFRKVELSKLKAGDKVTVSNEIVDGKNVAKTVTIQTSRRGGGGAHGGGGANPGAGVCW